MEKILLLGSTGFIGKNLKESSIFNQQYRMLTPTRQELDLLDHLRTQRYFKEQQPDIIINAAYIGVDSSINYTDDYLYNNLRIVTNVLAAAKNITRLKKIIYFGSSLEYKDTKTSTSLKENSPLEPKNVYGTVKMLSSLLSMNLARQWKRPLILLRPFNLYGKYDTKSVIYYIVTSIMEKKPLLLTEGQQVRDYLYIKDFIKILYKIIANHQLFENYNTYNIGTGTATKLHDLFDTIFKIMDYKKGYKIKPYPRNEYWYNVAGTDKLSQFIRLSTFTTMENGLKETIKFIQKNY